MRLCGGRCGRAKREVVDSLLLSGLWQLVSAGTINTAHSGDPQCPDHIRSTWGCLFKMLNPEHHPAAAKLLQSCPTLCDPTDGSPPGSPVPGTLQAGVLEWGAIAPRPSELESFRLRPRNLHLDNCSWWFSGTANKILPQGACEPERPSERPGSKNPEETTSYAPAPSSLPKARSNLVNMETLHPVFPLGFLCVFFN